MKRPENRYFLVNERLKVVNDQMFHNGYFKVDNLLLHLFSKTRLIILITT